MKNKPGINFSGNATRNDLENLLAENDENAIHCTGQNLEKYSWIEIQLNDSNYGADFSKRDPQSARGNKSCHIERGKSMPSLLS